MVTYKHVTVIKLLRMSVAHTEVRNHDPCIVLLTHTPRFQNNGLDPFESIVYLLVSEYIIILPFNQLDDNF